MPSVASIDASEQIGRSGDPAPSALRGSAWTVAGYLASQGVRFATNLTLQRLLWPEVFGIMALVSTFQQGLGMFSDIGIGASIIQHRHGEHPAFLRTAWTVQVIRGVILWAAAAAMAWPLSRAYHHDLQQLLPIAGSTAMIAALNSTAMFTLNRRLVLARLTLLALTSQVLASLVMIVWARVSPSVWALIAGSIVGSLATAILSHQLPSNHRDSFAIDRQSLRELLQFGRWIFASTALTFFASQGDKLLFAPLIPIGVLGIYNNALALATMPTQVVLSLNMAVLFPLFSHRARSGDGLGPLLDRARAPVVILAGVVVAGLISSGPTFVRLVYAPSFRDAEWMVPILAVACLFQVLEATIGAALLGVGQPRSVAAYSAIKLVAMVILIPLGYRLHAFEGALVGLVLADLCKYAASLIAARLEALSVMRRDLTTCMLVAMSAGIGLGAGRLVAEAGGGNLLRFLAEGTATVLVWLPASAPMLRLVRVARQ
ncbi:MAG TPA: oligosaccharide flippase family protein [Vicinamibacterales bacterium]|nr:oligosaccharide flippase family protein [Vicinamibacterales bacterium]